VPRVANLSQPIAEYGPIGGIFPWESPHSREDIVTVARNGAHLFFIRMGSGTGTRIRSRGYGTPGGAPTSHIPLAALVDRPVVVLDVPRQAGEAVRAGDVASALATAAEAGEDWHDAAVVLVTGWGERDPGTMGEEYVLASPYLEDEAAHELVRLLRARGVGLLLTDMVDVDQPGGAHARREWAGLVPWLRPPWPSPQAHVFLRHYRREQAEDDHRVSRIVTRELDLVVGLADCSALPVATSRITVLPLRVADVAESPCTVVAEVSSDPAGDQFPPRRELDERKAS
jgi:kynurenine formamidase